MERRLVAVPPRREEPLDPDPREAASLTWSPLIRNSLDTALDPDPRDTDPLCLASPDPEPRRIRRLAGSKHWY